MERDSYKRFQRSQLYGQLIQELEERAKKDLFNASTQRRTTLHRLFRTSRSSSVQTQQSDDSTQGYSPVKVIFDLLSHFLY